jgi:hypothetical protein
MDPERNAATLHRLHDEVMNGHNADAADEQITVDRFGVLPEDFLRRTPPPPWGRPEPPGGVTAMTDQQPIGPDAERLSLDAGPQMADRPMPHKWSRRMLSALDDAIAEVEHATHGLLKLAMGERPSVRTARSRRRVSRPTRRERSRWLALGWTCPTPGTRVAARATGTSCGWSGPGQPIVVAQLSRPLN